ncbi:possible pfkB family carbohydrate kinase [Prochlorococcus marinus str. MIT 9515]|uniref:Possible pfkB family carbohydrate kinase n=1 Tax=Prochlorococcus marinus (strain MIT 9515) TaxID=167542 RepID=A2BX31_PROM5|nr:PfkB family carbohydrate kinase [Prochlorococcus marinus]ABM72342.1 possible pfkB family carbohydrate kinase [Prochlorococcus marinus str. MIT 9515]
MFETKNNLFRDYQFPKGNLKFAVIGHIEWINFIEVDQLPKPGLISHSRKSLEYPAGGGAVIAKRLRELTKSEVHFFTSLGDDFYGNQCLNILENNGIKLHVAWRDKPTRKGFSVIDSEGERSITIIGDRLAPTHKDNLNWSILDEMDGIFITAADKEIFKKSRIVKSLCTTPRAGLDIINDSGIFLDGLIGSNLDPGEVFSLNELKLNPKYIIKTEGENGGIVFPGGRYKAIENKKNKVDSYGCGDSFAAGILYGLSSGWNIEESLNLAKIMGKSCSEHFGPYKYDIKI